MIANGMARTQGQALHVPGRSPGFSPLAAPSLAFLFWTSARSGALEKKIGLSEVSSQCMSGVTACQLARPGSTVWSAQDLRAASGARTGLAELGSGRGRDAKSKMLTEPVPGRPAVPSPGSLSPCPGDAVGGLSRVAWQKPPLPHKVEAGDRGGAEPSLWH